MALGGCCSRHRFFVLGMLRVLLHHIGPPWHLIKQVTRCAQDSRERETRSGPAVSWPQPSLPCKLSDLPPLQTGFLPSSEPQAALSSILANSTLLHLVTLTLELLRDQRPEGLLTILFLKRSKRAHTEMVVGKARAVPRKPTYITDTYIER